MKTIIKKYFTKNLMLVAMLALLYFFAGKLSFALFQQDTIVTVTVFVPEGIALAGVLVYGYRVVPGIFLGQLLLAMDSGLPWSPALGIALTNAFEALIAYKIFYYFKLDKSLAHIRDLIGLFLLIVLILQPFSALLGNAILYTLHIAQKEMLLQNIFFWWLGNSVGQMLIAPMLLILYTNEQKTKYFEYALTVLFFTLLNYVLNVVLDINNVSLLLVTTLPFAIYLATVNLSYATVATLTLVLSSLYFYHLDAGIYTSEAKSSKELIDMNFFLLSHIILVLIVGVLFREKENAIASLRSMAHYDLLTGLPNRHLLNDEIYHSIYLYERYNQESMICFIDLDGFKVVNDTYGHTIGDKLLQEVAKRIKATIRSTDTLLRLGGDEFLLILNNIEKEKSIKLLERVRQTIRSIDTIGNHTISVSSSIGVANCPRDGLNAEDLIDASDHAMYQAKQKGKNTIVCTPNCFNHIFTPKTQILK